jgi:hypothetical protein
VKPFEIGRVGPQSYTKSNFKQQSHIQQGEHIRYSSKSDEAQKVFVGPHFWLTKHYLNRVTESGMLHILNIQTLYLMRMTSAVLFIVHACRLGRREGNPTCGDCGEMGKQLRWGVNTIKVG